MEIDYYYQKTIAKRCFLLQILEEKNVKISIAHIKSNVLG